MKLWALFSYLYALFSNYFTPTLLQTATPHDAAVNSSVEALNPDTVGGIFDFLDDETVSAIAKKSTLYNQKLQNRINLINLKKNCPSQFDYLTKNGYAILMTSYKPAQRSYESLEYRDTKKDVIRMLDQRRRCIQSMIQAKDLIGDRLDQIIIALPPQVLNEEIIDADVLSSTKRYFTSIQRLVDTGLVKKIQIHSAYKDMYILDFSVEEMLYQFLSLYKLPSVAALFVIRNIDAFNQWAENTLFLKDLAILYCDSDLKLPVSIESLLHADNDLYLEKSNLPNLKTLEIHDGRITELGTIFSQLESLSITNTDEEDVTFMESICSKNNIRLRELSLDIRSSEMNRMKVKACLMKLKPHLQKFAFTSTFLQKRFWMDFTTEFLQDNAVLKHFSVEYEPDRFSGYPLEYAYLNVAYRKLNLTTFSYTGYFHPKSMKSIARFIPTQTSLTKVSIHSSYQIRNMQELQPSINSVAENKSIKELNLTFEVVKSSDAIEPFLEEFVDACSVLKNRTLNLNGIPIENVLRDLKVGLSETFVWKQDRDEDDDSVTLKFISKEEQHEFRGFNEFRVFNDE